MMQTAVVVPLGRCLVIKDESFNACNPGACVVGQQWRSRLRTVELNICGSNHVSVKRNNFSHSYPVTSQIMPIAELFAEYCEVLQCCSDKEPEIRFTP